MLDEFLNSIINDHLKKNAERFQQDLKESLGFLQWLERQDIDFGKPIITLKSPIFRLVYGGYDPLSVAGSLSKGGRFNVGGAQISTLFPNLKMQACLYGASSIPCAQLEAGEPYGFGKIFSLQSKRALHLWDLAKLVKTKFKYPKIKSILDSTPLSAAWELQKVPKLSQVLAYILRASGGDGLIYPSTKHSADSNIAIFIKDDAHAKGLFTATEMKE